MKKVMPVKQIEPLLVNAEDAAIMLGIHRAAFYRHKNELMARGVQGVRAGKNVLYTVESIKKTVARCADEGMALYESVHLDFLDGETAAKSSAA